MHKMQFKSKLKILLHVFVCFTMLYVFSMLYGRLKVYIVTILSAASFVLVSSGGSSVVWLSIFG